MRLTNLPFSRDFAGALAHGIRGDYNVFLSGGGLDSAAFLANLGHLMSKNVVYQYGQRTHQLEWKATEDMTEVLGIVPAVSFEVGSSVMETLATYNPNSTLLNIGNADKPELVGRNLALIQEAVQDNLSHVISENERRKKKVGPIAGTFGYTKMALNIFVGLCREDMMYPDANGDYIEAVNRLLRLTYGLVSEDRFLVNVYAPFSDVPKYDYIQSISDQVFNYEHYTSLAYSCWLGKDGDPNVKSRDASEWVDTYSVREECGYCYHCKKRNALMVKTGWYEDLHKTYHEVEEEKAAKVKEAIDGNVN